MSEDLNEKALEIIEIAKTTGKLRRGANEATKAVEKGEAVFIAVASDVTPPEVIMHIPLLCKEKDIPCFTVDSKEALGSASGLEVGTSAVAVIDAGEAKDALKAFATQPAQ